MTRKSQAIIYTVYSFLSMVFLVLFLIYRDRALPTVMLVIWLLGSVVEFFIYKPQKDVRQAKWIRIAALCVGLAATLAYFLCEYAMHIDNDALALTLMCATIVSGGLVSWFSEKFSDSKPPQHTGE